LTANIQLNSIYALRQIFQPVKIYKASDYFCLILFVTHESGNIWHTSSHSLGLVCRCAVALLSDTCSSSDGAYMTDSMVRKNFLCLTLFALMSTTAYTDHQT
jgi:hypothetical protein